MKQNYQPLYQNFVKQVIWTILIIIVGINIGLNIQANNELKIKMQKEYKLNLELNELLNLQKNKSSSQELIDKLTLKETEDLLLDKLNGKFSSNKVIDDEYLKIIKSEVEKQKSTIEKINFTKELYPIYSQQKDEYNKIKNGVQIIQLIKHKNPYLNDYYFKKIKSFITNGGEQNLIAQAGVQEAIKSVRYMATAGKEQALMVIFEVDKAYANHLLRAKKNRLQQLVDMVNTHNEIMKVFKAETAKLTGAEFMAQPLFRIGFGNATETYETFKKRQTEFNKAKADFEKNEKSFMKPADLKSAEIQIDRLTKEIKILQDAKDAIDNVRSMAAQGSEMALESLAQIDRKYFNTLLKNATDRMKILKAEYEAASSMIGTITDETNSLTYVDKTAKDPKKAQKYLADIAILQKTINLMKTLSKEYNTSGDVGG
jgi:hypothetical protein